MNIFKFIYDKFIFLIAISIFIFIPSLYLLIFYRLVNIFNFLLFKEVNNLNAFYITIIINYLLYLDNTKTPKLNAIPIYE